MFLVNVVQLIEMSKSSYLNPWISRAIFVWIKEMKAFFVFSPGFGSSIGLGVFVLITYVARYVAGPAVVLSALIATATATLSGKFYI